MAVREGSTHRDIENRVRSALDGVECSFGSRSELLRIGDGLAVTADAFGERSVLTSSRA